mmetsp:Transcript_1531/g.4607  ORF Transcript_1531/g.4607 Transcript_1531/m.4607 type:complete len:173 (+) Transcript_1531:307-825(+)
MATPLLEQPQTQLVSVIVPPGAAPGATLQLTTPGGGALQAVIPAGLEPGDVFKVAAPAPPPRIPTTAAVAGAWCLVNRCLFCPNACMSYALEPVDEDTLRVSGFVCACIVPCWASATITRSPDVPGMFDAVNCCGCNDPRAVWHFESDDAMQGPTVCCGPPFCGTRGWKKTN